MRADKKRPMVISVSRKTDIPAFYADWFINRVREGYCTVPNPFNPKQVARISLEPKDVVAFVFWTRNPRPLMRYLKELDERGYRYYFQYTILGYPREIDPKSPSLEVSLETFKELSEHVGNLRVIWRYDPIVFSSITEPEYHVERHARIAEQLRGYCERNVISIVDDYRKTAKRIENLERQDIKFYKWNQDLHGEVIRKIADTAKRNGMEIFSCAEDIDLTPYGVKKGKCVDDDLISKLWGSVIPRKLEYRKDRGQREVCGCTESRDIGMYDSCLFGCVYCYATSCFKKAQENHHKEHDPCSPSLLGHYEVNQPQAELPLFDELVEVE
ncbi:MAG: DUF1848 domain-containing protein [Fimbriimonadales bacterium]